ncbi:hypothetical protein ACP4OV_001563 [Aristida adscensionis]
MPMKAGSGAAYILNRYLPSCITHLEAIFFVSHSRLRMPSRPEGIQMQLPWEYQLRKYLLLLATLVATVTYAGGLNLPGGVWQESNDDHLAGDPILRATHYNRYIVFYYCNAAAFAASLVVILLILVLNKQSKKLLTVLRVVMLLDLLGLLGAYVAGSCRDKFTTWRKVLMLLATFMITITYVAGLNPPGGFWDNTQNNHLAGDPILFDHHSRRLTVYFVFNTTSFVASLLIIIVLLDRKLTEKITVWSFVLYGYIFIAVLTLMGAYATGSCRETDNTAYVISLAGAVLLYIFLQTILVLRTKWLVSSNGRGEKRNSSGSSQKIQASDVGQDDLVKPSPETPIDGQSKNDQSSTLNSERGKKEETKEGLDKARSLVLLLATLAASITYQAGLHPPGGLWQDDQMGHKVGDPILSTTDARRYKVFFYCNSTAFVASLVSIMLVQCQFLLKSHILEAAMILDLFGLMGAYAAGTSRDASNSIHVIAIAGVVLIYVVIHIVFFTLDHKDNSNDVALEKRRKQLLLLAILEATLTYQAGLTPPGGFWLKDDEFGHHAGNPVLFDNYPRRYKAFFYCNAISFMASIALIILLVNPNLYRPGIKCRALYVCMVAGLFTLMGAYAAGSSRHLRTSIYVIALAAAVLALIILLLISVWFYNRKSVKDNNEQQANQTENSISVQTAGNTENQPSGSGAGTTENNSSKPEDDITGMDSYREQYNMRKYLMLLGILAASVTYQSGLDPPGSVWQDNNDGHSAGDPILHDINNRRYHAFFYSNSTSFMASIVVIVLLLQEALQKNDFLLRVMHSAVVLDLLGLLVAYAAGCSRKLETSGYVIALVIAVLIYIGILVALSLIRKEMNGCFSKRYLYCCPDQKENEARGNEENINEVPPEKEEV